MMLHSANAQAKSGVENYNSISRAEQYTWIPVLHYMNKKGWYTEARYNYEDINTGSIYVGRNYAGGKKVTYEVTPMAGIVFGNYKGISTATNIELAYKQMFFSGQLQYTINNEQQDNNFFYNWSELGCKLFNKFYGGVSVQQTKLYNSKLTNSVGVLLGFETGKITVPFYLFNPLSKDRNLVMGLIIEWGN